MMIACISAPGGWSQGPPPRTGESLAPDRSGLGGSSLLRRRRDAAVNGLCYLDTNPGLRRRILASWEEDFGASPAAGYRRLGRQSHWAVCHTSRHRSCHGHGSFITNYDTPLWLLSCFIKRTAADGWIASFRHSAASPVAGTITTRSFSIANPPQSLCRLSTDSTLLDDHCVTPRPVLILQQPLTTREDGPVGKLAQSSAVTELLRLRCVAPGPGTTVSHTDLPHPTFPRPSYRFKSSPSSAGAPPASYIPFLFDRDHSKSPSCPPFRTYGEIVCVRRQEP